MSTADAPPVTADPEADRAAILREIARGAR